VTVLSARRKYLRVATIVPPFVSLRRVQDKISAFRTLKAIGAPQPQTFVISNADIYGTSRPIGLRKTTREHGEFGCPARDECAGA
jgi:hypothetical protein